MSRKNNEHLVTSFLRHCRDARSLSPLTVRDYTANLIMFLEWLGDGGDVSTLKLQTLDRYVNRERPRTRGGGAPAPATLAKDVAVLKSFYKYLDARGLLVGSNPANLLMTPKVPHRQPKPIPDEHWLQMWDVCSIDERVAFGLGFYGGLRCAEIRGLRPPMMQWPAVVGFPRKGGGDDIFPLGDVLHALAKRLPHLGADTFQFVLEPYVAKRESEAWLLPWTRQYRSSYLNDRMTKVCRQAGIAHYSPHQLRHSFVTNMLRAGVPLHLVSRLANHSNPQTTMGYVKAGGGELREWLQSVNRDDD